MWQMLTQTARLVIAFLVLAACFSAKSRLHYVPIVENAPIPGEFRVWYLDKLEE